MEAKVRKVVFKGANDYYTTVTNLLAQFDCTMPDIALLKDMAQKTKNTTYVKMMAEEMEKMEVSIIRFCYLMAFKHVSFVHQVIMSFCVSTNKESKKAVQH